MAPPAWLAWFHSGKSPSSTDQNVQQAETDDAEALQDWPQATLLPQTRRLRLAVATIPGIDCKYTRILLNPKAHKAPGVKEIE